MSGFGSEEMKAGPSTAPESLLAAEIPEEPAVERDLSPQMERKRCSEISVEEPPRKRLEASGVESYSPMHIAALRGDVEDVGRLLDAGAYTNCQDEEVQMALHLAMRCWDKSKLISEADGQNSVQDKKRDTTLHLAVQFGYVGVVKKCLAAGADTRCQDRFERTPLHLALYQRVLGAAELISDKDPGNDLLDEFRRIPLHYAARHGFVGIVKKLLAAGADTRCQDQWGMTPLHLALRERQKEAAELILDKDVRNSLQDENGHTPLHLAASESCLGIVEKLLAAGADTRCQDHKGMTPLHLAIWEGKKEVTELILGKDAGNNLQDENGRTPLHYAAKYGFVKIVEKLLAAGVNMRCKDLEQKTPLHLALENCKVKAAELISEKDGDNSLQDKNGHTPVYLAFLRGYLGVIKKMLLSGAHPHFLDIRGASSFKIAVMFKQRDVMKMLVSINALKNIVMDWENVDAPRDGKHWYMKLFAECQAELQQMKRTKVLGSRISYHDVASQHVSKVAAYLGNEEVRKELLEGNATRSFLNYSELITFRVEKAEKRRLLNDQCLKGFAALSRQLACVPGIVIDKIFPYLSEYEMRNFDRAFISTA